MRKIEAVDREFVLLLARSRSSGHNIFVEKSRPANQAGRINLVGGKVEAGEEPAIAASREFHEETGILVHTDPELMGVITGSWGETYLIHCYRYTLPFDLAIRPGAGESERFFWSHWDRTGQDERILPNLNFLVPMMNAGVKNWTIVDNNCGFDARPYIVEIQYAG